MRSERQRQASPAEASALAALWPSADWPRSVGLLKALHILTRDGALNADSRRKLKQVLHLIDLLRPSLEGLLKDGEAAASDTVIADLGAGKSYLGFMLYDLVLGPAGRGTVFGVEARPELVDKARALAADSGFARMQFLAGEIKDVTLPGGRADMVTALHACDTATDDAIRFALRHEAKVVALVPCCQAEVAALLQASKGPLQHLWRHPLHRREFGAHITNVIRGLVLEAHGYKVRVTEFVGPEHSLKNELILAVRHQRANPLALRELRQLVGQIGVAPALLDVVGP